MYQKISMSLGRKRAAFKAAFEGPMGDIVLGDLMKRVGYMEEPFLPGQPDQTAYNLGARGVVQHIINMKKMTPADIEAIARRYAADEVKYDTITPANPEEMYAA